MCMCGNAANDRGEENERTYKTIPTKHVNFSTLT